MRISRPNVGNSSASEVGQVYQVDEHNLGGLRLIKSGVDAGLHNVKIAHCRVADGPASRHKAHELCASFSVAVEGVYSWLFTGEGVVVRDSGLVGKEEGTNVHIDAQTGFAQITSTKSDCVNGNLHCRKYCADVLDDNDARIISKLDAADATVFLKAIKSSKKMPAASIRFIKCVERPVSESLQ